MNTVTQIERKIMAKSTKTKRKVKTTKSRGEAVETVNLALTVQNRFAVIGILPKQEDIIGMMMVRDIEIRMLLTQIEKKKCNFRKQEDGRGWTWDLPKKTKTFKFSCAEMELLRKRVTELDSQKKISADLLDLCILIRK